MGKRIFTKVISICLVLFLLPTMAFAEDGIGSGVSASVDPQMTRFEAFLGNDFAEIVKMDGTCTFTGIKCDGVQLTEGKEYTITKASETNDTITFTNSYMRTLEGKDVTFTFEYEEMETDPTTIVDVKELGELKLAVAGDGRWRKGSTLGLTFTVIEAINAGEQVIGVMLDDKNLLLESTYTAVEADVTLLPNYLVGLPEGQHTLKILIGTMMQEERNRSMVMPANNARAGGFPIYTTCANATFTILRAGNNNGGDNDSNNSSSTTVVAPVPSKPNPKTGVTETSNGFWWVLSGSALIVAAGVAFTNRKKTNR